MTDKITDKRRKGRKWRILAVAGSGLAAALALAVVLNLLLDYRYTSVITCDSAAEAAAVTGILGEAGIACREADGGLTVEVRKGKLPEANLTLGTAGYQTDYALEEVFAGGFASDEAEKQKKYILYLEESLKENILSFHSVTDADVHLNIPQENDSLITDGQVAGAFVRLEHNGEFTEKDAASLAKLIAALLNTEDMSGITIEDYGGNLLFFGGEKGEPADTAGFLQIDA